jgi:hypothetical protein
MLAAGKTIGQTCQSLAISEQTFHRWQAQYGGMKADEAKRLKHLEEGNQRLKKLLGVATSTIIRTAARDPEFAAELAQAEQNTEIEPSTSSTAPSAKNVTGARPPGCPNAATRTTSPYDR